MKENKTTTADRIRSMTDEEYLQFKHEYAGLTIRVLVNKKETKLDKELIIRQHKLGASQSFLAKSFGVSQQAISKILSNQ